MNRNRLQLFGPEDLQAVLARVDPIGSGNIRPGLDFHVEAGVAHGDPLTGAKVSLFIVLAHYQTTFFCRGWRARFAGAADDDDARSEPAVLFASGEVTATTCT